MQFLVSGLISGLISGLGMGGGVILVVILTYITEYTQQGLQTLNLVYYIPTAIMAIIVYLKNRAIDYKVALKIIEWAIIPTVISAYIANLINTQHLRKVFGLYLIAAGIIFFVKSRRNKASL